MGLTESQLAQLTPCHLTVSLGKPDIWFSEDPLDQIAAAAICNLSCPKEKLLECGELGADQEFGVWGGLTEQSRDTQSAAKKSKEESVALDKQILSERKPRPTTEQLAEEIVRDRLTHAQAADRYKVTTRTIMRWLKGVQLLDECSLCGKQIKFHPRAGKGSGPRAGIYCSECYRTYGPSGRVSVIGFSRPIAM